MIKFLVIAQDLRISGTSEGIVSRSFLAKLRTSYPDSIIDVVYLKNHPSDDQLELLPVNNIETHILNLKVPFFTKWYNKLYWRLFHLSLKERYIHKIYASYISKTDYKKYNHIFIRSSGLNYETIFASRNLPILKHAIINFHDPFPLYWYSGGKAKLSNLELFRFKMMEEVVNKAKCCITPSCLLSQDMQFLYGSKKKFRTLPHQFDPIVFDLSDNNNVLSKNKKITISYHGTIMFGRNIDILLDAYQDLLDNNTIYKEHTEFILRLRGQDNERLKIKYSKNKNIIILDCLNFSNSCYEQTHEADIYIILENGPYYSNVLVGKAPFLASLGKPILCVSPERSEMRLLVNDGGCIASYNNKQEIKEKLMALIESMLNAKETPKPLKAYFSDEKFKQYIETIINEA